MHIVLREDVTHGLTTLDANLAEVFFEGNLLDLRIRLEGHLDDFGLTVRVGGEVHDA